MSAPATTSASDEANRIPHPAPSVWWVRLAAVIPWATLYAVAHGLAWVAWRVVRVQRRVLAENLAVGLPDLGPSEREALMRRYYRSFGEVLVEVVKAASLDAQAIRERVALRGLEEARAILAGGTPVLLVAAHQCNWEWMLLALSLDVGYPLDAAYKPLVDHWAEREMLKVRTRFGARLVPAAELLGDIIRRGRTPRVIAMVADQEPRTSEHKHWTRFFNRDTAFFVGAEEIARATRFPVYFVGMRRIARGHYEVELRALAAAGEPLAPGELTERYVRCVEAQIRASPADWPWSHKRWKLKKSLYGR